MAKLAVIALNRSEHRQLLAVWKFFPFPAELNYLYLYTGADSSEELPRHSNFNASPFTGRLSETIQAMREFLEAEGVSRLCFASLRSFQLWTQASGHQALTYYSDGKITLADIRGLPLLKELDLAALLQPLNLKPALLRDETAELPTAPVPTVYEDYHSWLKAGNGDLLLTRNANLVSAVCGVNRARFQAGHLFAGKQAANLLLDDSGEDFSQTLHRLRQSGLDAPEAESSATGQPGNPSRPPSSYSFFAEYYDHYMSHVDYEDWLTLMLTWFKRFSKVPIRKVLEIACGTANAAEILAFRGYEVDACDSSPYMLHMADAKVFKPQLFYATLTDPLPLKDYDFIFCLFDSINYLTRRSEIKILLDNVHASLRPGGIFIFDISTLLNSLENFADNTTFTRVKDGYLIHKSNYEILSNKQFTRFDLFRKNGLNYDRLEERHVQRVYRSPELSELIARSDLKLQAIFAPEMRTNLLSKLATDIDNRYFRLFFLLQKPQ